ncbi:MAG: hypothetical protein ACFB21_00570 [Opitutales bacterium]
MTDFLINLAPFVMVFELVQVLVAERYIGIKQARAGRHPVSFGEPLPASAIFFWMVGMVFSFIYMLALLFDPRTGFQALLMLGVTAAGFALRRTVGLKWGLVVLTVERACVIGLMGSLLLYRYVIHDANFHNWAERHWPL